MKENNLQIVQPSLPKGGSEFNGISHTFDFDCFTGSAAISIPIYASKSRSLTPELSLNYHQSSGNSVFGLGFSLQTLSISRKTSLGIPRYDDLNDVFVLSGAGNLVFINQTNERYFDNNWEVYNYMPRYEKDFLEIKFYCNTENKFWKVTTKENITSILGFNKESKVCDANDNTKIFSWLLDEVYDAHDNRMVYHYFSTGANSYLQSIQYGNFVNGDMTAYAFELIFDYGEYDISPTSLKRQNADPHSPAGIPLPRNDVFRSYRSGFPVTTEFLCQNILMFHHFKENTLVRATSFRYKYSDNISLLNEVKTIGFKQKSDGSYEVMESVPLSLSYSEFSPLNCDCNRIVLENSSLPNGYVGKTSFQLVDLYREGLKGFLYTDDKTVMYYEPLGGGQFKPPTAQNEFPIERDLRRDAYALMPLDGGSKLSLTVKFFNRSGYYDLKPNNKWSKYIDFEKHPNEIENEYIEYLDVCGDGLSHITIIKDNEFKYYPSVRKQGFSSPVCESLDSDFPKSARNNARDEFVGYINLFGDGLEHRVRIRDGQMECFANLGYGKFDKKFLVCNPPKFGEMFDKNRLFFCDTNGSGCMDIIYAESRELKIYLNCGGFRFSDPIILTLPDKFSAPEELSFGDIYGKGYDCVIFSKMGTKAVHYIFDLCNGVKPRLLTGLNDNMGGETRLYYKSSSEFYATAKNASDQWDIKLPVPVQVVEKIETFDYISDYKVTKTFNYRDGFYDDAEREFKGFRLVTMLETEDFNEQNERFTQPLLTKSWFYTGGLNDSDTGYYTGDPNAYKMPFTDFDHTADYHSFMALSGKLRREEKFAAPMTSDDGVYLQGYDSALSDYEIISVMENNFMVKKRPAGVYLVNQLEAISYNYLNSVNDPLTRHQFTLESDEFLNPVTVCDVIYPRRCGDGVKEQKETVITVNYNKYINNVCGFRLLGVSYESRSYEINNIRTDTAFGGAAYFPFSYLQTRIQETMKTPLQYGEQFDAAKTQARIYNWSRSYFWNETQSDALPLGGITARALAHHTETALFTQEYACKIYAGQFDSEQTLGHFLENKCGYAVSDGYYWNRGLVSNFYGEKDNKFYLLKETENSFAGKASCLYSKSSAEYDPYSLSVIKCSEYIDENYERSIRAEVDYRTMNYSRIVDVNDNVSQAVYNPLGMVIAVSLFGMTDGKREGCGDLKDYTTVENAKFDDVIQNPERYLQMAATFYFYDFSAYERNQSPLSCVTLIRENDANIVCTISYLDGQSRAIETKTRTDNGYNVAGRTAYNSGGQPVKQYVPYLSAAATYERSVELPPPAVMRYDTAANVVRVETPEINPLGTTGYDYFFAKTIRTPFEEKAYDNDDCVVDSAYYKSFINSCPDDPPENVKDVRDSLMKAKEFHNTPITSVFDLCGNVVSKINSDGSKTYNSYDIQNRLVVAKDARITGNNFEYFHDMDGGLLKVVSADAGDKTHINNIYGKISASWDSRGAFVSLTYDRLKRLTEISVKTPETNEKVVEKIVYGDTAQMDENEKKDRNLIGQIYLRYDPAGLKTYGGYNILGAYTKLETRYLLDYRGNAGDELAGGFTEHYVYDYTNKVIEQIYPDGSCITFTHNKSGLLRSIVHRSGTGTNEIIKAIEYAPNGQRKKLSYGNGVSVNYEYNRATGRLTTVYSSGDNGKVFQCLAYYYDPVGNITRIRDTLNAVIYNKQQVVEPIQDLTYDSYYRLVSAKGRELNTGHENDLEKMEVYQERYEYDNGGNMTKLTHTAPSLKFTRNIEISDRNNRILSVDGSKTCYDAAGNVSKQDNIQSMEWNYRNQLVHAVVIKREDDISDEEFYVYDAEGNRARKITIRKIADGLTELEETLYMGGFGVKRIYRNGNKIFERESLNIADNGRAAAITYFWKADVYKKETDAENTRNTHFILDTITGSSAYELDENANIITYEEYFPFGLSSVVYGKSKRETDMKRYRYCGKEKDSSTGFYCYGVRYYDARLCRWVSCDPAGTADGLNLYQYCNNNPILFKDANGKNSFFYYSSGGAQRQQQQQHHHHQQHRQILPFVPVPTYRLRPLMPMVAGRIRIGVLFRTDARGSAHLWDRDSVQGANPGAEIVSIFHQRLLSGRAGTAAPPYYQHTLRSINAIFIPGGPAAHPAQGGGHNSIATSSAHEIERHSFEDDIILQALSKNIPILAVCGGSWRLANLLGAEIAELNPHDRATHNTAMTAVGQAAHDVHIPEGSLLYNIANDRLGHRAPQLNGPALNMRVNSVHWAQSVFETSTIFVSKPTGELMAVRQQTEHTVFIATSNGILYAVRRQVRITAVHDGTVEAYESRSHHYVMGVQWHPEYSPAASATQNLRIMHSLGIAANENRAASIIGRAWRRHVEHKRALDK